jgi:antitoxin HigA-1
LQEQDTLIICRVICFLQHEFSGRRSRRSDIDVFPLPGENDAKKLAEIHAGEILLEEFIKPMGITHAQLASDFGVPTSRISENVNGKRPITMGTAIRLGVYFKMEPRFWLNLQSEYDARMGE